MFSFYNFTILARGFKFKLCQKPHEALKKKKKLNLEFLFKHTVLKIIKQNVIKYFFKLYFFEFRGPWSACLRTLILIQKGRLLQSWSEKCRKTESWHLSSEICQSLPHSNCWSMSYECLILFSISFQDTGSMTLNLPDWLLYQRIQISLQNLCLTMQINIRTC